MTQDSKFNNLRARKKHNFLTLEWFGETQQKISQMIILKIKNICSKMSSRPFFYHFAITLIVKSTANFLILEQTIKSYDTSLNTQSCNRGLLGVQDFCFWAVLAAGPMHKKKVLGRL